MTATVKKRGGFLAFIAFLFSLVAIGMSTYLFYQGLKYKKLANTELQQIITVISKDIESSNQQLLILNKELADTNRRIDNIVPDNNRNTINMVNELISLANEGLILYNDVSTASRLLQNAHLILDASNDPVFDGLKFSITHDLSILNNLPKIDRINIGGQLDGLMTQINQLKQSKPVTIVKTVGSNDQSTWDKFVANIKSTFSGIFSVSKTGGKASQVLMPTEEVAVLDGIRINLLSARVALLQHDQENWEYSLSNVRSLIEVYYGNLSLVDNILKQIDVLSATQIVNQNVNIDNTLAQLAKLNNMR